MAKSKNQKASRYATTSISSKPKETKEETKDVQPIEPQNTQKEESKVEPEEEFDVKSIYGDLDLSLFDTNHKMKKQVDLLLKRNHSLRSYVTKFKDSLPLFRIANEAEEERYLSMVGNAPRPKNPAIEKKKLLFNLNAVYIALNLLGFEDGDIQNAMSTMLAFDFEALVDYLCLNLDRSKLPPLICQDLLTVSKVTAMKPSEKKAIAPVTPESSLTSKIQSKIEEIGAKPTGPTVNHQSNNSWILNYVENDNEEEDEVSEIDKQKPNEKEPEIPYRSEARQKKTDADDILAEAGLFFDTLEEEVVNQTIPSSVIRTYREFDIGKHKGKSPKQILNEVCMRQYHKTSKFERVKSPAGFMSKVTLPEECDLSQKVFFMDELCRSEKDSEHYVAVVALFNLKHISNSFSIMAPCFKDLWNSIQIKDEIQSATKSVESNKPRMEFCEAISKKFSLKGSALESTESLEAKIEGKGYTFTVNKKSDSSWIELLSNRQASEQYKKHLLTRRQLPVFSVREEILNVISTNQVTIVSGLTGSGKSTQIPLMILEEEILKNRGSAVNIFCTQPRRISTLSISKRVAEEFGESVGKTIGYQIRMESQKCEDTKLLFCTTGILLRKIEEDSNLSSISHVIIDEVHERSIESDFLLIVIKRILKTNSNPNLRVILMSATADSNKFEEYFQDFDCKTIEVPGRLFPVQKYYLEHIICGTKYILDRDSIYSRQALSNQARQEIMSKMKGNSLSYSKIEDISAEYDYQNDTYEMCDAVEAMMDELNLKQSNTNLTPLQRQVFKTLSNMNEYKINFELIELLLEHLCNENKIVAFEKSLYEFGSPMNLPRKGAILVFLPGWIEIKMLYESLMGNALFSQSKFRIFPLHSSLSTAEQSEVFRVFDNGVRKIVLATNIAETGITIPDVVFVIDSGKAKEVRYDLRKQLTKLEETFISRANADQRAGRAGRIQSGVCFRLFTNYRFENKLKRFNTPEILRLPLEELCLKIKLYKHDDIKDFLMNAIEPPSERAIQHSINTLIEVDALTEKEKLTELGKHLASLPVDAHLGKFIIYGTFFQCTDASLTIAAMFSHSKNIFYRPFGKEHLSDKAKQSFKLENSDILTNLNAYRKFREEATKSNLGALRQYCESNYLSFVDLCQIENIKRNYFEHLVSNGLASSQRDIKTRSGLEFLQCKSKHDDNFRVIKAFLCACLYPRVLFYEGGQLDWISMSEAPKKDGERFTPSTAFMHPSSCYSTKESYPTPWFVFYKIMKSHKTFVFDVTNVETLFILLFARKMEIMHSEQVVVLDDKICIQCMPRTAVLLARQRKLIQKTIRDCLKSCTEADISKLF